LVFHISSPEPVGARECEESAEGENESVNDIEECQKGERCWKN